MSPPCMGVGALLWGCVGHTNSIVQNVFCGNDCGGRSAGGKIPAETATEIFRKTPRKFAADKVLGLADPEFEEGIFCGNTEPCL